MTQDRQVENMPPRKQLLLGAVLFTCATLWLILDPPPRFSSQDRLGTRLATLEFKENSVQAKVPGSLVWAEPDTGTSFYAMDQIATLDGAHASIRFFDESEIGLDSNSLIVIEAGPLPQLDGSVSTDGKIRVQLLRGRAEIKSGHGLPVELHDSHDSHDSQGQASKLGSQDSIIRIEPDTEAEFATENGSVGVNVRVLKGSIKTPSGKTLTQGERMNFVGNIEKALPRDNSPRPDRPELKAPDVKIEKLETSKPTKAIPKKSKKQGARHVNQPTLALLRFFLSFISEANAETPKAAPTSASENLFVTLTFVWESKKNRPHHYKIQISNEPFFSKPILEKEIKTSQFQESLSLPPEAANYYFRVAGVSESGEVGEFSRTESFEILPEMATNQPRANELKRLARSGSLRRLEVRHEGATPQTPTKITQTKPAKARSQKSEPKPEKFARERTIDVYGGVWIGMRSLQNKSVYPTTASGMGWTPFALGAELNRRSERGVRTRFAATVLLQQLYPGEDAIKDENPFTPIIRLEALREFSFGYLGPYIATSSTLSFGNDGFSSTHRLLAGACYEARGYKYSLSACPFASPGNTIESALGMGGDIELGLKTPLKVGGLTGWDLRVSALGRVSNFETQGGLFVMGGRRLAK